MAYRRCPFLKLPDEVLLRVLSHLDAKTLLNVAQVCRRLNRLADDPNLFDALQLGRGWRLSVAIRLLSENGRRRRPLRCISIANQSYAVYLSRLPNDSYKIFSHLVHFAISVDDLSLSHLYQLLAAMPLLRTLAAGRLRSFVSESSLSDLRRQHRSISPALTHVTVEVACSGPGLVGTSRILPSFVGALMENLASWHNQVQVLQVRLVGLPLQNGDENFNIGPVHRAIVRAFLPLMVRTDPLVIDECFFGQSDSPFNMRLKMGHGYAPPSEILTDYGSCDLFATVLREQFIQPIDDASALELFRGADDPGSSSSATWPPLPSDAPATSDRLLPQLRDVPAFDPWRLTVIILENVIRELALPWEQLMAELRHLPSLQVLSLVTSWPFPVGQQEPQLLQWLAIVWDECPSLHTVRLWGIPGAERLNLTSRPSPFASVKQVLDLGWQRDRALSQPLRTVDELINAVRRPMAHEPAVAAEIPPFWLTNLRWLRLPTDRFGVATIATAIGASLMSLQVTLHSSFEDSDLETLVINAPRLRQLALFGARSPGLNITSAGAASIARLSDLAVLRLIALPLLRTGDLTCVAQGCPQLRELSLAFVGIPLDGSALTGLGNTLPHCRALRLLRVVHPGAQLSNHFFQQLENLPNLRRVAIFGYDLSYNASAAAALGMRAPYLEQLTVACIEYAAGRKGVQTGFKLSQGIHVSWDIIANHWDRELSEVSSWWQLER